jgi:anti-sigma factor RsiW
VRTMGPFCWLIRRRLNGYRDDELSPGTRRQVDTHLQRCERCSQELATLNRLHTALALDVADPPEAVWTAFWPQVRDRIAVPAARPEPVRRSLWAPAMARPRLGFAPALAAGALAVLAVVAPWQRAPHELPAPTPVVSGPELVSPQPAGLDQVVIQSIETEDPDVPVMVYASPESDMTVLWVFGLPRTGV